jgi:hypothetical protein
MAWGMCPLASSGEPDEIRVPCDEYLTISASINSSVNISTVERCGNSVYMSESYS